MKRRMVIDTLTILLELMRTLKAQQLKVKVASWLSCARRI